MAGTRSVAPHPDDYMIPSRIISKEPLAPAVRQGDDQRYNVVNYTVMAMIDAEQMGRTSKNVDGMLKSKSPNIHRLLGAIPGNANGLGLGEKWANNIIKQVGNYGEVFERNAGIHTPLRLKRGLNVLWTQGGMMYSAPLK